MQTALSGPGSLSAGMSVTVAEGRGGREKAEADCYGVHIWPHGAHCTEVSESTGTMSLVGSDVTTGLRVKTHCQELGPGVEMLLNESS